MKRVSSSAGSGPAEQFAHTSVQKYASARLVSAQLVRTTLHSIDRSTTNISLSQRKNVYNPLASALADVFGVEEVYS